jgi:predicted nucleic acid-binding protein
MRVVSNTSPISNLAIIGKLDLLRVQFREIWIPEAVQRELEQLTFTPAVAAIRQAIDARWMAVRSARQQDVGEILKQTLDPGESEAIALALECEAELVLMDERAGRQAAMRSGLTVTGALGLLLRAKRRGDISSIKSTLNALRTEARFFMAPQLEAIVLHEAGE